VGEELVVGELVEYGVEPGARDGRAVDVTLAVPVGVTELLGVWLGETDGDAVLVVVAVADADGDGAAVPLAVAVGVGGTTKVGLGVAVGTPDGDTLGVDAGVWAGDGVPLGVGRGSHITGSRRTGSRTLTPKCISSDVRALENTITSSIKPSNVVDPVMLVSVSPTGNPMPSAPISAEDGVT